MGKLVEAVITATAAGLLLEESKFLLTELASRVLRLSVRLLPSEYRDRYGEEWAGHLADVSGPISKVGFSLFLIPIGFRTRIEVWKESRNADPADVSYVRRYRLALFMLMGLVVRYRVRKIAERFGFLRESTKVFGIDVDVFAALVLAIIVIAWGRQSEALAD